jgi:hypothetical protein
MVVYVLISVNKIGGIIYYIIQLINALYSSFRITNYARVSEICVTYHEDLRGASAAYASEFAVLTSAKTASTPTVNFSGNKRGIMITS